MGEITPRERRAPSTLGRFPPTMESPGFAEELKTWQASFARFAFSELRSLGQAKAYPASAHGGHQGAADSGIQRVRGQPHFREAHREILRLESSGELL